MTRRFWISLGLCFVLLASVANEALAWGQPPVPHPLESVVEADLDQPAAPPPIRSTAADSVGGCGWDQEFGTAAQIDCEALLTQLKNTYGIRWEAPIDPAVRLYDFNNRGL